jgi:hypothetical protein
LRLLEELLDFEDEELRDERERLVAIPESESISGGREILEPVDRAGHGDETVAIPSSSECCQVRDSRDSLRVHGDYNRR